MTDRMTPNEARRAREEANHTMGAVAWIIGAAILGLVGIIVGLVLAAPFVFPLIR